MKRLFTLLALTFLGVAAFSQNLDYSELTKKNHPRLFFTEDGFNDLKRQLKAGDNPYLNVLHDNMMRKAEKDGLSDKELDYDPKKVVATFNGVARDFSWRIISAAYGYRLTGDKRYLEHVEYNVNRFADNFRRWTTNYWLENSEVCLSFALAYDWLYKDLSRPTKKKIVAAIADIGYKDAGDEEKAWFYNSGNNWNHVCNASLVCAALATYEEHPEASGAIIKKAIQTVPAGMKGVYYPDGVSPEGPSYWDYATNYANMMFLALEDNFGTDCGLSASDGYEKGGDYRLFCVTPSGTYFNYGDCNAGSAKYTTALWYYALKFGRKDLLYYAVQELDRPSYSRAYFVAIACAQRLGRFEPTAPEKLLFIGRGKANVLIARTGWEPTDAYLGFKGGVGKANHSHLDEGSFIYEADGLRWAEDFYHPSYEIYRRAAKALKKEKKSFKWYEKFVYGNPRHNTLTIDGKYMDAGATAPIVDSFDSPERRGGTMDLSGMFKGQLASAFRTAAITGGHDLEIKDVLKALPDSPAKVRWSLVTPAAVEITPDGIILSQKGKTMTVKANIPVQYRTWSTRPGDYDDSPVRAYDPEPKGGNSLCGFEFELPAGSEVNLVTTFSK